MPGMMRPPSVLMISNHGEILGGGELTRKLIIQDARVSAAAREKIEKMGGTVAGESGGKAQEK